MNIVDWQSRILAVRAEATNEPHSHLLDPVEIRFIADGTIDRLRNLAASSRLHAADPKGDTPLHLAARTGNLALCDLFIQSGADPESLNHERQTPADVAFAEGHDFAAQLLSSLIARSSEPKTVIKSEESSELEIATGDSDAVHQHHRTLLQQTEPDDTIDNLDELLNFAAEEEAEAFFSQPISEKASGIFVALVNPELAVSDDEELNWELDLSPAHIAGEGIGSSAPVAADHCAENDFLKVRNRGRQSVKHAVVQTGTRLSIDPEICINWAEETLAKGWCSFDDVDRLVAHCEGNGDLDELRANLQRNLEAAGFDLDQAKRHDVGLWDARSDIL